MISPLRNADFPSDPPFLPIIQWERLWVVWGRGAVLLCLLGFMAGVRGAAAALPVEVPPSLSPVGFSREIAPVLVAKCLKCHGPDKPKGRYQLDTFERLLNPGESQAAPVVRGEPDQSELYRRLVAADEDDRMPQKADPLSPAEIALLARWIRGGASFDGPDPQAPLVQLVPRALHPEPPDVYPRPVPIAALSFRPGGRELAVGGYHEITFWDPAEGKLLRRVKNAPQQTQCLAFSPDGAWLAVAGGSPGRSGEVTLFEAATGTQAQVVGTAGDSMFAVCFSPDGAWFSAAGADHSIHLYETSSRRERRVIQAHADWVMALAFDATGRRLASASRDRTARLFDVASGELEATYPDHGAPVCAVAFGDDGQRIYSGGRDRRIVAWNVTDGKRLGEITGFDAEVTRILAADGQLFSASADRKIRQHSLPGRKLVRTYLGHQDWIYALAYDAANRRLASGSHDGEVRIWDVENGSLVAAFIAAPGYSRPPGP